jgi:hypothetical protein
MLRGGADLGTDMDFIERWFGISPDGGDGTLELLYVAVGVLIVAIVIARIVLRLRYRRSDQR